MCSCPELQVAVVHKIQSVLGSPYCAFHCFSNLESLLKSLSSHNSILKARKFGFELNESFPLGSKCNCVSKTRRKFGSLATVTRKGLGGFVDCDFIKQYNDVAAEGAHAVWGRTHRVQIGGMRWRPAQCSASVERSVQELKNWRARAVVVLKSWNSD